MKSLVFFLAIWITTEAGAQGVISPNSPFFALSHDLINCQTQKEERGRLEKPNTEISTEVCILVVHCQSKPKMNPWTRGPDTTFKTHCWANKKNVCPSAQVCATDRTNFKRSDVKFVKKLPAAAPKRPASKSATKAAQ